ncbi:Unknown protein [Striga hermonthica]|uniref:Uncharacterized protein n=1 Tax=Striga hermonthica TaxID=68872 RepID=A0A9N7NT52_STRHE|nr:Unknown protein [Striga hermonthica]
MRTTLQPWLDLLNKAPQNHYFAVSGPSSIRPRYPEPGFGLHGLDFSMDRMFGYQKIESMRKMMLMQEQVFKQQVHELHRLYNLQKKLMQELEKNRLMKARLAIESTSYLHITRNQNDTKAANEENDLEVELTLGIGQCNRRRNRGLIDETNESKTGSCSRIMNNGDSGLSMNNINSSSYNAYQEKNTRPHWLIRDLSQNRT